MNYARTSILHRPSRQLVVRCVLTATATAALAGCNGSSDGETTPPSGPSSSGTLPTSTSPTTASPSEDPKQVAIREVQSLVAKYIKLIDKAAAQPQVFNPDVLTNWLAQPELREQLRYRRAFAREGFYTNSGATKIVDYRTTRVTLDPTQGTAVVRAVLCYDYGDVVTFDKDGKDVSTGKQLNVGTSTYRVVNDAYPDASRWRIAAENIPGKPCRQ